MRKWEKAPILQNVLVGFLCSFIVIFLHSQLCWPRSVGGLEINQGVWRGTDIEYVSNQILLKITDFSDTTEIESLLAVYDLSIRKHFDTNRWGLVQADTNVSIFDLIDSLKTSSLFEWAEPNIILYPSRRPEDPYFIDSTQWPLWNTGKNGLIDADIDAPEAWEIDTGRGDLIISVLDTGFPYYQSDTGAIYCHKDLSDPNKYIFGYICYDTCWKGSMEEQIASHGGPVTGIISAMTDNNEGIAGVLWACKIYVMKAFVGGDPAATVSGVTAAIDSSLSFGAKIINISAGTGGVSLDLEEAVSRANDSGCVIVAADVQYPSVFSSWGQIQPGGYRNVIAVNGTLSNDTYNYGYCGNDSFKVTVAAPATVTKATTKNTYNPITHDCTGYAVFNQTSCATPYVTGVAGLLKSHSMTENRYFPPDSIRWYIERTADDVEDPGWDGCTGYGRVNALRALMAMDGYYPNVTGYLRTNATWGDTLGDTIYVLGDVVVPVGCTLTIDHGAVVKFLTRARENFFPDFEDPSKCEIFVQGKLIVNGSASDSVWFVSEEGESATDSSWYGIRVDGSGSAKFKYSNFEHGYYGICFNNSANDTVINCRFRNNKTAIRTTNSNLVVKNCVIEKDWTGIDGSYGYYGIFCYGVNPTIKNTFFEGLQYGIKVSSEIKFVKPTPLIEECGFYNIGGSGILSSGSSPAIRRCCFKGTYGDNCIKIDNGVPYIFQCYMASEHDSIPVGILFVNGATGKVRRTAIWDYSDCAIKIMNNTTNPDFGKEADSGGCNWFEEPDSGNYYFWSNSNSTISAKYNFWDLEDTSDIRDGIHGKVDINPVLNHCDACFPYYAQLCSDLPPDDPMFSACKLAADQEKEDEAGIKDGIPHSFSLYQNYPNPFNPETVIKYDLPRQVHINLTIYNIMGQKVRTLVDEIQEPGYQTLFWNGRDDENKEVASGIYFFKLKADNYEAVKRMILLR